jgi:hypothetical protein
MNALLTTPGRVVVQDDETLRWFITMGHPGFNSPANNAFGYATQAHAFAAITRYSRLRLSSGAYRAAERTPR